MRMSTRMSRLKSSFVALMECKIKYQRDHEARGYGKVLIRAEKNSIEHLIRPGLNEMRDFFAHETLRQEVAKCS